MKLDSFIQRATDAEELGNKLEQLLESKVARAQLDRLAPDHQILLLRIIDISDFLYRFLNRYPEHISLVGTQPDLSTQPNISGDLTELIRYKYCTFLQITSMDLEDSCDYKRIFSLLSSLADQIICGVHNLLISQCENEAGRAIDEGLAIFALGKLGAMEINYSSDIDLIFTSAVGPINLQAIYERHIRKFCSLMEMRTDEGFLYRVDLNLRPYGKSGALVLNVDAMEQYYEGSHEAWERFAWLRARTVGGNLGLANELLESLIPFVFHRTLSTGDIDRFLQIKSAMADARNNRGGVEC